MNEWIFIGRETWVRAAGDSGAVDVIKPDRTDTACEAWRMWPDRQTRSFGVAPTPRSAASLFEAATNEEVAK